MDNVFSLLQTVVNFCNDINIAGLSLITWIVIFIVIAGIGFIIRGNK